MSEVAGASLVLDDEIVAFKRRCEDGGDQYKMMICREAAIDNIGDCVDDSRDAMPSDRSIAIANAVGAAAEVGAHYGLLLAKNLHLEGAEWQPSRDTVTRFLVAEKVVQQMIADYEAEYGPLNG